ncbi:MAG: hypothetical protein EOO03_08475 [Chitinophagaceae bacterium]|nr:MAG: hypothetical protein EOO03_08475 [Chitinophagaceae bacterium]
MKTILIAISCIFFTTSTFAQTGEEKYSKVKKHKTYKVSKNAHNTRSNPPDLVVLKRQSKPTKPDKSRFQNADRSPFTGRIEKTKR